MSTPTVRGRVQSYDRGAGIEGWLLTDTPDFGHVELVVEDVVVAAVAARIMRPELNKMALEQFPGKSVFGFKFPSSALKLVKTLPETLIDSRPRVRVKESGLTLAGVEFPDVKTLLKMFSKDGEGAPSATVAPSPASAMELVDTVNSLRLDATSLLASVDLVSTASHLGFVEVVVRAGAGLFIIGGWSTREIDTHVPAIIHLDGRHIPAGLSLHSYERPDLPAGARAFCALVRADANLWRGDQDFILLLESNGSYLRSRKPINVLNVKMGLAWLKNATKISDQKKQLLSETVGVELSEPVKPEVYGCHAHIDKLVVFPGFGAMVSGWFLSPVGSLSRILIQQGAVYASARSDEVSVLPRPDLSKPFSNLADRTHLAGFSALCLNPEIGRRESSARPQVIFNLDNGQQIDVDVALENIRIGYDCGNLSTLLSQFPSFHSSAEFGSFAASISADLMAKSAKLTFSARASCDHVLVTYLPDSASDARLSLLTIERATRRRENVVCCVLVGPKHPKSKLSELAFSIFPRGRVVIAQWDGNASLETAIAEIARTLDAARVTFVQKDFLLSEAGWRAADRFFEDGVPEQEIFLYGLPDWEALEPPGFGAFTCGASAFLDLKETLTPCIYPDLLGRGLASAEGARTLPGAARRLKQKFMSRAMWALDERVFDAVAGRSGV